MRGRQVLVLLLSFCQFLCAKPVVVGATKTTISVVTVPSFLFLFQLHRFRLYNGSSRICDCSFLTVLAYLTIDELQEERVAVPLGVCNTIVFLISYSTLGQFNMLLSYAISWLSIFLSEIA